MNTLPEHTVLDRRGDFLLVHVTEEDDARFEIWGDPLHAPRFDDEAEAHEAFSFFRYVI